MVLVLDRLREDGAPELGRITEVLSERTFNVLVIRHQARLDKDNYKIVRSATKNILQRPAQQLCHITDEQGHFDVDWFRQSVEGEDVDDSPPGDQPGADDKAEPGDGAGLWDQGVDEHSPDEGVPQADHHDDYDRPDDDRLDDSEVPDAAPESVDNIQEPVEPALVAAEQELEGPASDDEDGKTSLGPPPQGRRGGAGRSPSRSPSPLPERRRRLPTKYKDFVM